MKASERFNQIVYCSDKGRTLGKNYNSAKDLFQRINSFCIDVKDGKTFDGFTTLKLYCGFESAVEFIDIEKRDGEFFSVIHEVKQAWGCWEFFYLKEKHKHDVRKKKSKEQNKLRLLMSSQISSRLKRRNSSKRGINTEMILESKLGYSIEQLKAHIESKFVDGMSWDNHGDVWHLDHKIPDSWFEYKSTDDKGFKDSWALDNLQPMFKELNIMKGNKFIY